MTARELTTTRPPGLFTRSLWALRRYWWLALLTVAAMTATALLLGSRVDVSATLYEAESLVLAESLQIDSEELPRTAAAVFGAGSVARTVASDLQLDVRPDLLIPDTLALDPVENTVALRVLGISSEPGLASDIANAGAMALAVELNRIGPDFGVFTVHTAAVAPSEPATRPVPILAIGLVAGLIMAAGLIGLLIAVTRPIVTGPDAAGTIGLPLLGEVVLHPDSATSSLSDIAGLSATVRSLRFEPGAVRHLVGTGVTNSNLSLLGCTIARMLSRKGNVVLVDPGQTRSTCGPQSEAKFILRRNTMDPHADPKAPVVVVGRYSISSRTEGGRTIDPAGQTIALVVGAGVPSRRLTAAAHALGDGILGIVFVRKPTTMDLLRRRSLPSKV